MELWLLIFISSLSVFLAVILNHLLTTPNSTKKENKRNLPPGPPSLPILGNLLWLTKSLFELEPILRQLRSKYGPIISIRVFSRTLVFITDASVAHKALVQKGSTFSDRPPALGAGRIMNSNQHNISSAAYGPLWRLLRRNLLSEILHPSRVRSYAQGRKWVLDLLTQKLTKHADSGEPICVVESFQYSMFCLLLLMCFGQKLDKDTVKKIETTQRRLLVNFRKFNIFVFLPRIGKLIFRKRWNELLEMRHDQEQALIPLIRSRKERQQDHEDGNKTFIFGYVDSLLDLELPEEGGRKLTEGEMVTLCSEFLNGGTDTTSTSLQWIMANLVKHQDLQQKLVEEEEDDPGSGEVDGEDRSGKPANGGVSEGVVDVDEDEESDADEEETETTRVANGSSRLGVHHLTNGFRVAAAAAPSADGDDVEEDMDDEDDDDLGEEIDEEEGEDDDVVEVHEIDDSDEDEDGVEEDDEDDEEDEEDVDDEEDMEPGSTAQLTSAEGEIDGHEQGEEDENGEIGEEDDQAVEEDGEYEDDDEENGEIGEEDEQGVEENGEYEEDDGEGEDEEEDFGSEYLVRPVRQAEEDAGGSDLDPGNEDEGEEDEVEDEEDKLNVPPQPKRRRPDGSIEDSRPPPKHPKHH